MTHELERMARDVRRHGLEGHFKRIHHFAQREKYKTPPLSLERFRRYCEIRAILDENQRTIERAQAAADGVRNGLAIPEAIDLAWRDYPGVK